MAASRSKASNSTFTKNLKKSEVALTSSNRTINSNLVTNVITIANQKDFSHILKTSGKRLLVVEFFAKWCGPCRILSTKLEELAKSYDGRISVVKVDVDECELLTSQFNILAVPTFLIMRNRKKLLQFISGDVQALEKILEKYAVKPVFNAAKGKKF